MSIHGTKAHKEQKLKENSNFVQRHPQVGAPECWHKKSTFKAHLFETYKMSKIWGLGDAIAETMLFHSAYSNSYVNLAVFKAEKDRPRLSSLVGEETEQLIHLFCNVPRHELIYENLLKKLSDEDLSIPPGGMTVAAIHTKAPLHLTSRLVAVFLAMTMVDFSEQLYSWQDQMFQNDDGKLYFTGTKAHVLWPGPMKPGLWMACLSRMGRLVRSSHEAAAADGHAGQDPNPSRFTSRPSPDGGTFNDAPLPPIPKVFAECTMLLGEEEERKTEPDQATEAASLLAQAIQLNPHVAEPHVLLAQLLMQIGKHEEASKHACRALELFCQWGTAWDKRMAWDAWVAWTRAIISGAKNQEWPEPTRPMGMLNLGLVSGL
ncbi:hypothetical protein DUNSADRAFT_17914 [Dunaliella salina]|uniref:DUF6817 domain-containing protein n=1 Tax=Dunaliella salina TaxID=3046 RepID=A0ABQ7H919_DUNSA|nr:hypothetical protein DUNSADRAFT_17914 [Dunaliella salina]|eukprot:KAF5843336.1 hypothetical protein DUNSADRAFT_17914 [Dunaliella salina]